MATKPKSKTKDQLLTEKLMRGGKSRAQYDTEQRMRSNSAKNQKAAAQKKLADAKAKKNAQDEKYRTAYKDPKVGHLPTIFANDSRKRFGEADAVDVGQLGKDVIDGKITKDEAIRRIRQGVAVNDPDNLRVGLDVSADLDPKLNAIERRRKIGKGVLDRTLSEDATEAARIRADIEDRTRRTSTDIGGIYAALVNRLAQQPAQVAQDYSGASQQLQQNYAALQAQIAAANQTAQAGTNADIAQAGGLAPGTQAQAQQHGNQDAAAYADIAGIQNQGLQGLLAVGQQGEQNIARGQVAYQGSEGARQQAGVIHEGNAQVNDIVLALQQRAQQLRDSFNDEDSELQGQYADLDESRFTRLYEGRQALDAQQAQAAQDAEDRAYEREMAERALGIKEFSAQTGRYSVDAATERHNAKLRQDATIAANKHNLEVQRLTIEKQKLTDPIQRQLIEAKIKSEKAAATKALAEADRAINGGGSEGAGGKPDNYTRGMTILQNIPNIRPDQLQYLQRIVDTAAAKSDYDKLLIENGDSWMMKELKRSGNMSPEVRRYTRQALAIICGAV